MYFRLCVFLRFLAFSDCCLGCLCIYCFRVLALVCLFVAFPVGWRLQGGVEAETAEKCNTNLQRCAYIVSIMFCSFFAFPLHLVPPELGRSSRRRRMGKRRNETKEGKRGCTPKKTLAQLPVFLQVQKL